MVQSMYHNSKTGSSASLHIDGDEKARMIRVEVCIHDNIRHKYDKYKFDAERFGEALDCYKTAVERFEAEADDIMEVSA